jgi:site-specific DNA-methyltransferase (adenine-specific)
LFAGEVMTSTAATVSPPAPFYEDGAVQIYHGDCLELMPLLGAVDHVITDPPYDAKTHKGARYGFHETSSEIEFAPLTDLPTLTVALLGLSRRWVVCFCSLEMLGGYSAATGDAWVRSGFWRRPNGVPQFTGDRPGQPGEGIAIMHREDCRKRWNGSGHHAFWDDPIVQTDRVHPTQKPLRLMSELVRLFTDPGELIFDPFAGSGTTLRAAKDCGRRAIGIEISEQYCEVAARRMAQEVLPL